MPEKEKTTWARRTAKIATRIAADLNAAGLEGEAHKILIDPYSARYRLLVFVLPAINGGGGADDERNN